MQLNRALETFVVVILGIIHNAKASTDENCNHVVFNVEAIDTPCTGNNSIEVLRQLEASDYPHAVALCCIPESQTEIDFENGKSQCEVTTCVPASFANPCDSLPERHINGQRLNYENLSQEPCSISRWWWPFSDLEGAIALCRPTASPEKWLKSMAGAEDHEFPHQALLTTKSDKGLVTCGATVYNRRFLITAAHCALQVPFTWLTHDVSRMTAMLGSNIRQIREPKYVYRVKRLIPHPHYQKYVINDWMWINWKDDRASKMNDIALVELDRDIEFGENVKALEIAPKDFNPFEFADKGTFIGWGNSEGQAPADYLRKHTSLLRTDEQCSERLGSIYEGKKSQLFCTGGILNGELAPTFGSGDSGGPAICRGKNGQALLCGVASFGSIQDKCREDWKEIACPPNAFAKVSFFVDWIREEAGTQEQHTLCKSVLFGRNVGDTEYLHQVSVITGSLNKRCGGTLLDKDMVVTSASCMFDETHDTEIGDVIVKTRSGKEIPIIGANTLPNFKLRTSADGNQTLHRVLNESIYDDDLVILLLFEGVDIPYSKLPRLPHAGETFLQGEEVAIGKDGVLKAREFTLLSTKKCKERVSKSRVKMYTNLDNTIICGVEKYSGGSTCDRELCGGLICRGNDGKDVLCGVQKFRLCITSLPSGFTNVGKHLKWMKETVAYLRYRMDCPHNFLDEYYRSVFKFYL